ncbi:MAG: MarR family winged helix-turn-helix transcriptional regulator [Bacillota bacterium]
MDKDIEKKIQSFSIDNSLGFIINRVAIIMRKRLTYLSIKAGVDITPEEFAILGRLWEEDGLLQTALTDKTLKDKTTVTRLLERLIQKSLIEKQMDETDRRNFRIYLTQKGKDMMLNMMPIVTSLIETACNNISQQELTTTIKSLRTIFQNLNNDDGE